jgi:hypothetical protein
VPKYEQASGKVKKPKKNTMSSKAQKKPEKKVANGKKKKKRFQS